MKSRVFELKQMVWPAELVSALSWQWETMSPPGAIVRFKKKIQSRAQKLVHLCGRLRARSPLFDFFLTYYACSKTENTFHKLSAEPSDAKWTKCFVYGCRLVPACFCFCQKPYSALTPCILMWLPLSVFVFIHLSCSLFLFLLFPTCKILTFTVVRSRITIKGYRWPRPEAQRGARKDLWAVTDQGAG